MKRLSDSIQFVKGVGPKLKEILEKVGISTVYDALFRLPVSYIDRKAIKNIGRLMPGEHATIRGRIESSKAVRLRRGFNIFTALVEDDTGSIECVWFNQAYLRNILKKGSDVFVSGTVDARGRGNFNAREFEIITSIERRFLHAGRIIPNYSLSKGISKKKFRTIINTILEDDGFVTREIFRNEYLEKRNLMPLDKAVRQVHFPDNFEMLEKAKKRIKYHELFLFEYVMAARKEGVRRQTVSRAVSVPERVHVRILNRFPFELTGAQKRVITEIRRDLCSLHPMNRLLQGDVGSGKTVIALYCLLAGVASKLQSVIMAPTEILAEQHCRNISEYLAGSRVRICLLTGSIKPKEKKQALEDIAAHKYDIIIGTHALIEKSVRFAALGTAVIDEQHKFGVEQRKRLVKKGDNPHILFMTATPIPRTLSLTVFGDLDISVLDEMPPGRKKVNTVFLEYGKMQGLFSFIADNVRKGRQVYFVYPLIDKSDKLPLRSAVEMYKRLSREIFPDFNVVLLHGGMKAAEKEKIMTQFKQRKADILVSTIVIEVGIDVPNATVMVIDHVERYGLSQLHQLRGRIGRGDVESHCILLGMPKTQESKIRRDVMIRTNDGFRIAEEDLKLRGPGEFLGTRQSGLPEFKAANIIEDFGILQTARKDAFEIAASGDLDRKELMAMAELHFGSKLSVLGAG